MDGRRSVSIATPNHRPTHTIRSQVSLVLNDLCRFWRQSVSTAEQVGKLRLAGGKATEHGIHSRTHVIHKNLLVRGSSLCAPTRACNFFVTETRGQQAKKQYSELALERVTEQLIWGEGEMHKFYCGLY